MEKITIKDIARDAGVSIATVSRAINPHTTRLVTPPTRKRILDLVRNTGYLPSPIAKRLATGKSTNIVLFIGTKYKSIFYTDYYMKLLGGAMQVIEDTQYNLVIRMVKLYENRFDLNKVTKGMDIAASIVCDWKDVLEVSEESLENTKIPVVILNRVIKKPGVSSIACDNFKSAHDAAAYLIGLGHRKIAIIKGTYYEKDVIDRFEGYKKALTDRSIPIHDEYMFEGVFSEETGFKAVKKFMSQKERPTAIFATNDEMAIGAFMKLQEMGLRCPRDISLIGFDGIAAGQYLVPSLTTMRQPIDEMARLAVKEVIRALGVGRDAQEGTAQLIEAKLLRGGTCDRPSYIRAESAVGLKV